VLALGALAGLALGIAIGLSRLLERSLYHVLGEFAKRNINLTKIESRPTKQKPWEYNFYVDFEGHRGERRCVEALKALEKSATFIKILGSYPRAS
jgi:prephenate dehydratase